MRSGICSFSFHRLLASGESDVFGYIDLCKQLGCTQLDPWSAHLTRPEDSPDVLKAGKNPSQSHTLLGEIDDAFIDKIGSHAKRVGLPFGTIAVDGAHIYEPSEETRREHRARAYRWLDVGARLGAKQVRIDAGGPAEMPPDVFEIIVEGYTDLVERGKRLGIEILIENHWGPSVVPDNLIRILQGVRGLGMLYDTRNFPAETREEGRRRCAPYAKATHVKTKRWDAEGNEIDEDIASVVAILQKANYRGVWGIESVPEDGDEVGGARKTIELLKRLVR
jgi:sugar phosphate isomerase/epimerase